MIKSVIFISTLALASGFSEPETRTAEAYKHPSLHQLSWLGRQVAAAMSNTFALDEKTTFLYNHPARAYAIRETTCDSWALAASLCAPLGSDPKKTLTVHHEEADAVRHFSLSAHLACSQGPEVAEIFLAANEGNPAKWKKSSLMDIHNNYQGIHWAADRQHCHPFGFQQRVADAAWEKLRAGELMILQGGDSLCASPEGAADISRYREYSAFLRALDARCGGKTVTSP